jgi:CxxC motif-containing protein (DUF1111 family)
MLNNTLQPRIIRAIGVTAEGVIDSGANSVSFANTGTSDVKINDIIIKSREVLDFNGGENTLGRFSYDAQSSEILITELRR